MSDLRPYQATAVESALHALTTHGSAVLQMPTGAGKTKAATEIIRRHNKPIWFICHRQEIERQASKAFTAAGIEHGIVSPRAKPDYDKPVQIVSVATLARRMGDLPLPSLAIWDECHHVPAVSWSRIREALSGRENLGLTATPERLDGKGLSEWFNELVVGPSTRELIDDGWLSDFRYFAPSEPDLRGAKLRAGDYRKEDIDKAMDVPVLIGDAIAEYKAKADGKRALVFCSNVEASKALVERFNCEGISACHVDGTTPTDERDAAIEDLKAGSIKVLSNVEVFTEGFDLPAIDAVVLLRPTKSLALFLQMIGRVLRKADGKDRALIFDHAGLWLDHDWFDLPIEWSLDGGARQRRLAGRTHGPRRCPECKEVRATREMVCACGYEFPTGREIGEYDGELRELRGAVPEGCLTPNQFRKLTPFPKAVVRGWITKGLPHIGGCPRVKEGLDWVSANVRLIPDGNESQSSFAKRMGVASGTITDWIKRGMPISIDRSVNIDLGTKWVNENRKDIPSGNESQSDFARRMGVDSSTVRSWIKSGLPYDSKNGVPITRAEEWVRGHQSRMVVPMGCEKKSTFARRYGKSQAAVHHWIEKGLPHINGFPIIVDGDLWVAKNVTPPPNLGEETKASFARRIGVSYQGTITDWIGFGLPCGRHGHIDIQRGLEWVRDNTNIKIPPEAWPVANDNDKRANAA